MPDDASLSPESAADVNAQHAAAALTAPPVNAFRAGWRTTEFWLALALIVLDFALAVQGLIPADHAVGYATVTATIYKVLRAWMKLRAGRLDFDTYLAELAAASGPDANGQARSLHNHETKPQPVLAPSVATVGPLPLGEVTTGAAPEPAGSGTKFPIVAPLIAAAALLLLGGCKTSEPAFYLRGDFLLTAGIFGGLWLLGGFFLIRGIRNAPTGNDGDDGGRDQDNHGAE